MAADTTILNGDVDVYYLSNNRAKLLDWGGTTGTYTMNELYSAMATLLDESTTIDDGSAFFADTPVEYTTGKIDAGDNDPWYVSFRLMEHITGGSLRTSGWTHVQDTNIGIVIVPGTNVNIDADLDVGQDVTGGTDGAGTILELIEGSKGDFLVIRPDDATAAKEFTANGQTLTSGRGAFTFTQHATEDQNTGEMIWANIYSIGTIDPNVHMYVYQGARATTDASSRVFSINSSTLDYWGNGHIDICVPIMDWARLASAGVWNIIDAGYLRVFARKGGDLFASFEVSNSITSGGRNPVPMQTSLDLDAGFTSETGRGHGTKKISFSGAVAGGSFVNGEIISGGTSLGRGIIDVTNSTLSSGGELVYWPIATAADGGLLKALQSGETVTGEGGANVTTDGVPADDGAADTAWFSQAVRPTITFANTQVDVDNDTVVENYGITIDCKDNLLTEVYQWMKYICQYGQGDTDEIEAAEDQIFGEEYEGATAYFGYSGITGTIAEGESVTQQTTLATGVIISHDAATNDIVLLRSTRGTFNNSNTIDADDDADTFTPDEAGNFAATVAAPLGTFAGGTYFGARGVVLTNVNSADENSYILTDIEGNSRQRPVSITITVTNVYGTAVTLATADLVAVYALTGAGGDIDKDTMACDGGETVGTLTLDVDTIPVWVPASGRVILVDIDAAKEYVIGYSSYAANQFVLSGALLSNLTTGTDANTLVSTTAELDNLKRGDIIVNDTRGAVQYVTDVQAGSNTVNCSPDISGQVSTDTIYVNSIPDITVSASDKAYAAVIHEYPTGVSASASIVYPGSEFFFRVKVRNTRETDLVNAPIKPYSSDGSTTGTNQSIPTVRTIDTIIT
jgi:hypothetical protein